MTHVQAMSFKGLCARAILRIFCFCDKRDMPGCMSYYPSSCIDHILHNGAVTTPLASWCQSIKAKGKHTQDGGREKEKQSQPHWHWGAAVPTIPTIITSEHLVWNLHFFWPKASLAKIVDMLACFDFHA